MNINENLTQIETGFNVAGSIPIVAIFSGPLRVACAKIQFIAGGILGVAGFVGQLVGSNERKWEIVASHGVENMIHGSFNVLRGVSEFIIGLTAIGPLGLLFGQMISNNRFAPIIKYTGDVPAPSSVALSIRFT